MKFLLRVKLLTLGFCCALLPVIALAGFDEGVAAYEKKDYATVLREFKPLAIQGNASAQSLLGLLYANGEGVPQDYKEGLKWTRLSADQGFASSQHNLGYTY